MADTADQLVARQADAGRLQPRQQRFGRAEIAFDLPVNGQLRTIRFDRDAIAKAGYNDIVIMAVTNSTEYPQMKKEPDQPVVAGETPIVIF